MSEPITTGAIISIICLQIANILITFFSNLKKSECCGAVIEMADHQSSNTTTITNNYSVESDDEESSDIVTEDTD